MAQTPPSLLARRAPSLEGVHGTVEVPSSGGFWKNFKVFVGPAILVSVGYMDPGNWATDLKAGAVYRYDLLWVVAASSIMAMVLQVISARLGVATGKDLAQACRDWYPGWTRWPNWIACEIAIGACDMAEVLGSAVAIHLLFPRISILLAVGITALDVLVLLALQGLGVRKIEAFIFVLVGTIAGCYFVELFVLPQTKPGFAEMGAAILHPQLRDAGMVALAIGIIGATVMPHNLYLHSALVQTRKFQTDDVSIGRAIKYNQIDSVVALLGAFFVNAAIMVMAAVTFHPHVAGVAAAGLPDGHGGVIAITEGTDWIQVAYATLTPIMGAGAASLLFAVALLASGQSSTVTGTLAGQVVMEGFMHWQIRPWVRRMLTRGLAIVPAIVVVAIKGDQSITSLIEWSQIILGIQLPLAMIPLLHFTSSRRRMGKFANGWFLLTAGWASCALITALDLYGIYQMVREGMGL